MKTCNLCLDSKKLEDFHVKRGGHAARCKSCCKATRGDYSETSKKWYQANKEKVAAYGKKYVENNREAHRAKAERYRKANPDKVNARSQVAYAVSKGTLLRPSKCELCQEEGISIEAHHPDYSKPLDVEWLCAACHKSRHANET